MLSKRLILQTETRCPRGAHRPCSGLCLWTHPPIPTHSRENQRRRWPQAKPAMGCSMQDPDQSPAHHVCHAAEAKKPRATWCPWPSSERCCTSVPAKEELMAISPLLWLPLLDVLTADAVVITAREIPISLMRADYVPPLI